ncbi:hypothetical protein [Xanthobacter sp. KR7-225]|uniref:hypothetical protein n=1 Tax=Xanthobacter sp. KR7-225 TaxID=3156613 RepID=UPI0032B5D521
MSDRLITRIGRALYGDQWKGPTARELEVQKGTVDDWDRGRMEPLAKHYVRLLAIAEARLALLQRVVAELRAHVSGSPRA